MFCFSPRKRHNETAEEIPPPLVNKKWFSHWSATKSKLAEYKSTDKLPDTADVVVIGSGFTGASLAHHLVKLGASEDIVILEAREVCSGASGRNGGHLAPNYLAVDEKNSEHVSVTQEEFKTLAEFERLNFDEIYKLIQTQRIECSAIDKNPRGFFAFNSQQDLELTKYHYEFLSKMGLNLDDVILYEDKLEAQKHTGLNGIFGALSIKSSPVNPYQLVTQMLEPLLDSNKVKLYTHTPVTKVDYSREEKSHYSSVVRTDSGDIRAHRVILATNAYSGTFLDGHLPSKSVYPVRGQVSRWVVSRDDVKHLPLVQDSISIALGDDYFSVIPEKSATGEVQLSVVLGGARLKSPTREVDISDDNSVNPIISKHLKRISKETFGIDKDPVEEWTGIMGFTSDPKPYIGIVPGEQQILAVVGFMGHGMPRIYKSAEALVRRYVLEEGWPEWFPQFYRK